jgi:hypothetical protein
MPVDIVAKILRSKIHLVDTLSQDTVDLDRARTVTRSLVGTFDGICHDSFQRCNKRSRLIPSLLDACGTLSGGKKHFFIASRRRRFGLLSVVLGLNDCWNYYFTVPHWGRKTFTPRFHILATGEPTSKIMWCCSSAVEAAEGHMRIDLVAL